MAEATQEAYAASGADSSAVVQVEAFLDDMPRAVCGGGPDSVPERGSTVAELAAAGKAAVLVPFPQAADDHQRKNAEVFVEAGAAEMMLQAELTMEAVAGAMCGVAGG